MQKHKLHKNVSFVCNPKRGSDVLPYIAFTISLISLMVASPIIAKFLIYFFYKPKLDICFTLLNGRYIVRTSEIFTDKGEKPLNIRNKDAKRDLQIELEYVASKPVKLRLSRKFITDMGLRGWSKGGGFVFRVRSFHLPGNGLFGHGFPFERYPEEYTLDVIMYAKMKMSEFDIPFLSRIHVCKLPYFFGEVDLKPVKKSFVIKP